MTLKDNLTELKKRTEGLNPESIITVCREMFGRRLVLASSLGEEDQVLTDMMARVAPDIEIFTLDTGRLFSETYDLLAKTQKRYQLTYNVYYPDTKAVEAMVRAKGINLFYESVENRRMCCGVRKVEPLKRALAGVDAWICGLRKGQSLDRNATQIIDWDEANGKIKISPLANWSLKDLRLYIEEHAIDTNPLHARGFTSIGCACCTRAVTQGEDPRSGRWWWEQSTSRECGLHKPLSEKGNSHE